MKGFDPSRTGTAIALALVLVLGLSASAQAHSGSGWIVGRVTEAGGGPAAGVTVTAFNDADGGQAVTDSRGEYSMQVLAGEYTVGFELADGTTQYAHRQPFMAGADPITVADGKRARVDERLLGFGSVAGRLVDAQGRPALGWNVHAYNLGTIWKSSTTDSAGRYRIDHLQSGDFYLSFSDSNGHWQTFHGVGGYEDGTTVRVANDRVTTVDERLLPPATLRVVAHDVTSGAPVTHFCASAAGPSGAQRCTETGEVTFADFSAGRYQIVIEPTADGRYPWTRVDRPVTAGRLTTVDVPLQAGGRIAAIVTDRLTGAPVPNACVTSLFAGFALPNGAGGPTGSYNGGCSDADGRLEFGPVPPGTYHLFATASDSTYGAQWVGPAGGTGRQDLAARVTVREGQTTVAPAVLLDPPGSVEGTVTVAGTGAFVPNGFVSRYAFDYDMGPSTDGYTYTDSRGRYRLDGLGPYDWPLMYLPNGAPTVPAQWLGGYGNRLDAPTVRVVAGQTATFNATVRPGTLLTGQITVDGRRPAVAPTGKLTVYNAVTHDIVGIAFLDRQGDLRIGLAGPQQVLICYELRLYPGLANGCFRHRTELVGADPVTVPGGGTARIALDVLPT